MDIVKTIFDILIIVAALGILATSATYFLYHLVRMVLYYFIYKHVHIANIRIAKFVDMLVDDGNYKAVQTLLILSAMLFTLLFILAVLGAMVDNNILTHFA